MTANQVIAVLVCVVSGVAGWLAWRNSGSASHAVIRYRLTVEVEVDGRIHANSAVREVIYQYVNRPGTWGVFSSIQGEAIPVDLGSRGTLFVLLSSRTPTPASPFRVFARTGAFTPDNASSPGEPATPITPETPRSQAMAQYQRMARLRATATLLPGEYPALARFRPATVEELEPKDLATAFGGSVAIKRMTLTLTDDPPTEQIERVLPWLSSLTTGFEGRPASVVEYTRRPKDLRPPPPSTGSNLGPIHFRTRHTFRIGDPIIPSK